MKVALFGNQNSGKTTLFNALTGTNQKIGNWPGVTIERKEGHIKKTDIVIVDLPGIYSLSPYSSEEEVSRNYLLNENPDVIINIIDGTCVERSLYLTTQLMESGIPVIIALNMMDILEKEGVSIDDKKLSKLLNTSVVRISARKETGVDDLVNLLQSGTYLPNPNNKIFPKDVESVIEAVSNNHEDENLSRFEVVKMIEKDPSFDNLTSKEEALISSLEERKEMDIEQIIANERYNYIEDIKKEAIEITHVKRNRITDKLDKIFLNKWAALPIFVVIMALIYLLSVGLIGGMTVGLVDMLFNGGNAIEFPLPFVDPIVVELSGEFMGLGPALGSWLESIGASSAVVSLVQDGVVGGVGAVLNFVPQIMILFVCLSILESTGYMSRIAFFLDRIFHKFGLSGKSLIPFIVGSGCSVPGIMASRTVEDDDERKLTVTLTPFIPCSAKLPIIALFAGYFFSSFAWLITVSLYVLAIVVILLCGILLKKFFFKGHTSTFISELPAYKAPSFKYVVRDVWEKTWSFIVRAGTIILLCSVVVWFLGSFSYDFRYIYSDAAVAAGLTIDDSLLASIGKVFAWIFAPMLGGNVSWAAAVSAIQGLVAKEQVVSSMNVIAGLAEEAEAFETFASTGIFGFFDGWSAYGFMVFNLFSAPCFGAIGAMRREFGNAKHMMYAVLFQTGLAWVLGSLIGMVGWIF